MGKRKAPPAVEGGQLEDVESWSKEGRRWGMLALHLAGVPLQDAAGLMGYSTDAPARRALAAFETRGDVSDAHRAGRPRAVTKEMGAKLLEYAAEAAFGEGAAYFLLRLQADLGLPQEQVPSHTTVQRWLKSQNLEWGPFKRSLELSNKATKARLEWALKYIDIDWSLVLFSDSSMISSGPTSKTALPCTWHTKGKVPRTTTPRDSHFTVHGYACITSKGATPLRFVTGTKKKSVKEIFLNKHGQPFKREDGKVAEGVTAEEYLEVLDWMIPAAKVLMGRRASLTFMQDNAGPHGKGRVDGPVYNMVREKVEGFGADLLEWPPYSPDMNPIEQCWAVLKMKVWQAEAKARSSTMEDFKQRCQDIWAANFCHEGALENYYKSYRQRVEKLIANEGKQVA